MTAAIWSEPQPKRETASGWKVATTPALIEASSNMAIRQKATSTRRL